MIIQTKAALSGVLSAFIFLIMVYGTTTVHAELVGYWGFDEGDGAKAADSSGKGNDGTVNGASWVPGKKGKALKFDGSDDSVTMTIANPAEFASATGSIEFWMKANSKPKDNYTIFLFYEKHYTDYIACYLDLYGVLTLAIEDNNEHKINVSYDLDKLKEGYIGKWIHIKWVQDGKGVKLYVNGKQKAFNKYKNSVNSGEWWTKHLKLSQGRLAYGWRYFDGAIDEFKVDNQPPVNSDDSK